MWCSTDMVSELVDEKMNYNAVHVGIINRRKKLVEEGNIDSLCSKARSGCCRQETPSARRHGWEQKLWTSHFPAASAPPVHLLMLLLLCILRTSWYRRCIDADTAAAAAVYCCCTVYCSSCRVYRGSAGCHPFVPTHLGIRTVRLLS